MIEKVKFSRKKFQKSNDILILQNQDPDLTCVNGFVSATVEMRGSAVKGWAVGLAASSILFLLVFGEKKIISLLGGHINQGSEGTNFKQ